MQLANQCNCRTVSNRVDVFAGVGENPLFVALLATEIFLVVVIVQRGGAVFHTRPLDVGEWCRCVAFALGSFPLRALVVTFLVSLAAAIREDDEIKRRRASREE
jgi:Ca2+ transporting ATPase